MAAAHPTRHRGVTPRWVPVVAALAAGAVALTVAGCAGTESVADRPGTGATSPSPTARYGGIAYGTGGDTADTTVTTAAGDPTAGAPRGPLGSGEPVTIAFGGDVHFEGELRPQLLADPAAVLDPVEPVLASADLAVVNLETTITERGTPEAKEYTFRAPPSAVDAVRAGGIDVVSLANNHGMDFGTTGLEDTLLAEYASGFPFIGIGLDDTHAYEPFRTVIRGQRIAVIGATQVLDDHLIGRWTAGPGKPGLASAKEVDRLTAEVRAARADSDTVVVFLHWGTQGMTCPNPQQQVLARALVDAGADVIVGTHAHRVLAGGMLGDAFVHYGLGNFVFYGTAGGPKAESGILTVTVTGRRVDRFEWLPARIANGVARPLSGAAAEEALARWRALRACTDPVLGDLPAPPPPTGPAVPADTPRGGLPDGDPPSGGAPPPMSGVPATTAPGTVGG